MSAGGDIRRRVIAHMDCDSFYASVELLRRPELRGKPVVVSGIGPRAVVTTASYEARRFGVHSAMPASRARRLCPQAVFIPPDFAAYRAKSRDVWAIVEDTLGCPMQRVSLDEAYLDITAVERPLPVLRALVASLRERTGITVSVGVVHPGWSPRPPATGRSPPASRCSHASRRATRSPARRRGSFRASGPRRRSGCRSQGRLIRPAELIQRKRDGRELDRRSSESFVLAYARGDVPDYQLAAFLTAVYFRGLSTAETFALTDAMVRSGETIDLGAALGRRVVDKHSTGGVGDKTTLAVGPIVAACGVPLRKDERARPRSYRRDAGQARVDPGLPRGADHGRVRRSGA